MNSRACFSRAKWGSGTKEIAVFHIYCSKEDILTARMTIPPPWSCFVVLPLSTKSTPSLTCFR